MRTIRTKLRASAAVLAMSLLVGAMFAPSIAGASNIGNEGCTPGYWKIHTTNWEEYTPATTLDELWDFPEALAAYRTTTMAEALALRGGRDVDGAAQILVRAATAAYLNAAHEGVGYPYRRFGEPFNLALQVNNALASLNRETMINLAAVLDTANNLGCPLN